MHPAPSVILFTVLSGLGFGLLTWLGIGEPDVSGWVAFVFFVVAYALAVGGLIASTFHLGNPKRALKAFSQWRTSWLSREAWLSVGALCVMGLYALIAIFFGISVRPLGWLGAGLSLATVGATSMIYAQLRSVPRWNHWTTPALFLVLSAAGGGLLAGQTRMAAWALALAGIVQLLAWWLGDKRFGQRGHSLGSATGLGAPGRVRAFEPPHTGPNYLLREMVYIVGRKHQLKLRVIGFAAAFVLPVAILSLYTAGHTLGTLALLCHIAGAFVLRWLFFAEAEHVVGLYYGKR